MFKRYISIITTVLALSLVCQGQNSFFTIEDKKTQAEPDTSDLLFEDKVEFNSDNAPEKDTVIIKDFNAVLESGDKSDTSTVLVRKGFYLSPEDSLMWRSIDTAYAVFDSLNVDPYGYDPVKFLDTLYVDLYDSIQSDTTRWFSMPLDIRHETTSGFGARYYRWHYGTDIRLDIGDTIRAAFDGIVRISKNNPGGYGLYVMVRHYNGFETIYGHMSKRLVKVGDEVKAGQAIGLGGNTGRSSGPHLHYEFRYKGNPVNPELVYDFDGDSIRSRTFVVQPSNYDYVREMRKKVYHRIRPGDTLSGLAVKYRTSIRKICRLNGISTRTVLRVGRVLRVR